MADGLLRGAARFDQGKQHRLRCAAGPASDELQRGRTKAGGEGGGDNINSADDKMMRGVFSLAEERTARIAGTRGGIEEGREGESQSGGGNAERGRAFMPRLSYIAPAAVGQSVNADKKVIPGAIHPKVLRERRLVQNASLGQATGFLPSLVLLAARRGRE